MGVRFNGAATFPPRKSDGDIGTRVVVQLLQWGRDVSAAEIIARSGGSRSTPEASMGPRRFRRGNKRRAAVRFARSIGFNGAATFPPRKFAGMAATAAFIESLQWGRDVSAAEMSPFLKAVFLSVMYGFNGAATFPPRK